MSGPYISIVAAFLEGYEAKHQAGEGTLSKAALAEVLEEFVLFEIGYDERRDIADRALRMLGMRHQADRSAVRLVQLAQRNVTRMRAELARQKTANAMMQEHLIEMADRSFRGR